MSRFSGPGPYFADIDGHSPAARLRAVKRREAEERNARTPMERTRAYRRQLEEAARRGTEPATSTKRSKKRGRKTAA